MEGESEKRRTPSFIDKIMEEQKIMLSQSDLFKQIIQIFFLLGIVGLIPYYFLWHFTYFEQTSPTNALTELFIALGILVVALLLRDINYILWILLKKERRKKHHSCLIYVCLKFHVDIMKLCRKSNTGLFYYFHFFYGV